MKKIFTLVVVFLTLFLFTTNSKASSSNISDVYIINNGLGRGVDVVKSKYANPESIIVGSNIFNDSYLKSLTLDRNDITGNNYVSVQKGNSFQSYYDSKKSTYNAAIGVTSSTNKIFTGTIESSFSNSISNKEYESLGQYYYTKDLITKNISVALPNYLDNLEMYQGNLTQKFLFFLDEISLNRKSYNDLFSTFGTHVIASAIFGGKISANYSVTSKETYYSSSIISSIENEISAGIIGLELTSSDFKTSVNYDNLKKISSKSTSINSYINSIGGNGFFSDTQGNYTEQYQDWKNSVKNNPKIIDYNPNGLLALWKLVPNSHSQHRQKMEDAFNNYLSDYNKKLSYNMSITTNKQLIRATEYKITDAGRFKHDKKDNIYISSCGYSYDQLIKLGVKNVALLVKFDAKEIDHGVQYVFLYDGPEKSSKLLGYHEFEHGGSSKKTSYSSHEFIFNISLTDLTSSYTIRYGASGFGSDDWKNKNLYVSYSFH